MTGDFDNRVDREADAFGRRPVLTSIKWGMGVLAVVAVLGLLYIPLHFALGWFGKAGEVAGPGNVSRQYQAVINDWNGMQQAAANACQVKDAPQQSNSPSFLEDPAFAYAAKYRQIAVDYNTRQNDIFEAKLVGPKGYPRDAPTLEAMQAQVC